MIADEDFLSMLISSYCPKSDGDLYAPGPGVLVILAGVSVKWSLNDSDSLLLPSPLNLLRTYFPESEKSLTG
jgi:hypothetical protein